MPNQPQKLAFLIATAIFPPGLKILKKQFPISPKYAHTFDGVSVPYPASDFVLEDKPEWIRQRLTTWHGIYGPLFDWRKQSPDNRPEAVKDFEDMVHAYWGTILSVDDRVGSLVAYLRESGQFDRTLIVFMGDNGLLEGEHGMVDKRAMHEPSILDLCDAPALANIQGRSWAPLGLCQTHGDGGRGDRCGAQSAERIGSGKEHAGRVC